MPEINVSTSDAWKLNLCVFWYIVFLDIAARAFLSCAPVPILIWMAIGKLPQGSEILQMLAGTSRVGIRAFDQSVNLWITLILRAFEFGVMITWLRVPVRCLLSDFGFRKDAWRAGLRTGAVFCVALGGGFLLTSAILSRAAGWNLIDALGIGNRQPFEIAGLYRLSYMIVACLAGPFFEDIFFIGLLFAALRNRFALRVAFPVVLLHFIAAHILTNLLPAGLAGPGAIANALPQLLIWCAGGSLFIGLYARYKTLLPSMMVHAVGNALMFWCGFLE